jgi:hypothetical protein
MSVMVDLGKMLGLVNAPMVDSMASFIRPRTLIEYNWEGDDAAAART